MYIFSSYMRSLNELLKRYEIRYDNALFMLILPGLSISKDEKPCVVRLLIHWDSGSIKYSTYFDGFLNAIGKHVQIHAANNIIVLSNVAKCYFENDIGPYMIRQCIVRAAQKGNVVEVEVVNDLPGSKCDLAGFIVYRNCEDVEVQLRKEFFDRLYKGYVEDGLIWALVKKGEVSRNELPEFIENDQHYYWPRGDILRESLYAWYSTDDEIAFLVYLEVLEQMLNSMNEFGGVLIPYITAARMRNIYGAPQQLYAFESLYRAYQIIGLEILKEKALNALKCFLVEPPQCLGFYEVGNGIWFRWGSYHYLSRRQDKKEDLLVLNTHLMGVVGFAEACVYGDYEEYCDYAKKGLKALKNLLHLFKRSDGYFYYSLYTKDRFGEKEDVLRPVTRGYHVLSSTLMIRAGRLLKEQLFVEEGLNGCIYAYENYVKKGDVGLAHELVKCLVEGYRALHKHEILDIIADVMSVYDKELIIPGYMLNEVSNGYLTPTLKVVDDVKTVLLEDRSNEFSYLVYSKSGGSVIFSSKRFPCGVKLSVNKIEVENRSSNNVDVYGNQVVLKPNSKVVVVAYVNWEVERA